MHAHEAAVTAVKLAVAAASVLVAARGDYVLWAGYTVFLVVLVGLVVWLDKPKEKREKKGP